MSLIQWILTAVTPLLLATSKSKRQPAKRKTARRDASKPRARAKPAARRASKPRARAQKPARRASKPRARAQKPARRAPTSTQRIQPTRARVAPPTPAQAPKPAEAPPSPKPMPPIGRAILLAPEKEKYVDTLHPTFRWLSVGGATRYEVAWSDDPNLTAPRTLFSIATEATVPVAEPLQLGKTYYWRVRGGNDVGWSAWSEIATFHVLAETP